MWVLETVAVAFGLYSALPVPAFKWNEQNMRYALAAFPLVGAALGLAIDWRVFVAIVVVFLIVALLTRKVSAGSCAARGCAFSQR